MGRVEKEYLCLLVGRLQQNEGTIDLSLPGREGKPVRALTRFKVAKRFSETTLVRANIATGRMHQIRLHFARYGHPVVMDDQHGDFSFNKKFRKAIWAAPPVPSRIDGCLGIPWQASARWTASLPADLAKTLEMSHFRLRCVSEKSFRFSLIDESTLPSNACPRPPVKSLP